MVQLRIGRSKCPSVKRPAYWLAPVDQRKLPAQARNSTASPNIANGTGNRLTGTFYAAGAPITFAGGSCSNFASQVVVDSMNLSNNAQFTIPYSSSTVASKSAGYGYPIALIQ